MGFNCGIVGLPNVGKSTIFNALTNAGAQAANFPFCTIEPNIGIVPLPDQRLKKIASIFKPQKVTPTAVEFVDIAGLVEGASKGEGLGNKFLGHIKNVDAIAHVVRCYQNPDVVHVRGKIDPLQDIDIVNTELILADLETVSNRIEKSSRLARVGDKKCKETLPLYQRIEEGLNQGKCVRVIPLSEEEKLALNDLCLMTIKPVLYVCNTDEGQMTQDSDLAQRVKELASGEGAEVVSVCGTLESEISQMNEADKEVFLADYGLVESGLDRLAHSAYRLLKLVTYFTAGEKEVRAWTVTQGTKAPQAAGKIHSDFEKGFIRADVYHYDDLIQCGSEQKAHEKGLLRLEGRDYVVKDGDIMHFRFNV